MLGNLKFWAVGLALLTAILWAVEVKLGLRNSWADAVWPVLAGYWAWVALSKGGS